ncbi:MAG: PilZ domain-containing protein [Oleiphilaceae bacterium]|nr:PilZ domain-containing protein [Oleiphilaceae bacterium]
MSASDLTEHRRFYRIHDRVGLEYRRLDPDAVPPSAATCFDGSVTLTLQEELRKADLAIRAQLNVLAESDRRLVQVLTLMNQKLDTLARIMAFQQKPLQDDQWQEVTLSEGGLAFHCTDDTLRSGDTVALRLTLAPELNQVALIARVIDRVSPVPQQGEPSPDSDRGAFIHLQFRDLDDDSRQQIARHVLRLQARQRQQRRNDRA